MCSIAWGSGASTRTETRSGGSRFGSHEPFVFGTSPDTSSLPMVRMEAVATSGTIWRHGRAARTAGTPRCRVPPHAGPGTRLPRRYGGVFARTRPPHTHGGFRAAELLRGVPRRALQGGRVRLRLLAGNEVALVRQGREPSARLRAEDPPREARPPRRRAGSARRSDLALRARAHAQRGLRLG